MDVEWEQTFEPKQAKLKEQPSNQPTKQATKQATKQTKGRKAKTAASKKGGKVLIIIDNRAHIMHA